MSDTYIIAEAGRCHGGSLRDALDLVFVAKDAGADAVKFQMWSSAQRLADRRRILDPAPYEIAKMPVEWLPILHDAAQAAGLDFLCTAYLPEDIPVIAPYVAKFKIASLESQDIAFIRAHLGYYKEIMVSFGCWEGEYHPYAHALHCTSAYPCPPEQANISAICAGAFPYQGFSDHTTSLLSGALAVACGATIIEKHVRLYSTPEDNPDYPHSLTPTQFHKYVQMIREAEVLLGDGIKKIEACELPLVPHIVRGEP